MVTSWYAQQLASIWHWTKDYQFVSTSVLVSAMVFSMLVLKFVKTVCQILLI